MKIIIAMLFAVMSAQGAYVSFEFDIKSSGASIYACNAGLKHKGYRERVCYNRETLQACNATIQCQETRTEDCDCVCTGTAGTLGNSGAGERLLDIMSAKTAIWTENGEQVGQTTAVQERAGGHEFNRLFSGSQAFSNQLRELTFKLGSERYGAEYFVDICYRSTQIDYDMNDGAATSSTIPNYIIKRKLTVTDMAGSNDTHVWDLNTPDIIDYSSDTYQNLAGLEVSSSILCKDKDGQTYRYNVPTSSGSFQDASAQSLFQFASQWLPNVDLKGCVVRYNLRESNRSGIESVRKWKMQMARVCTETAIEDPESAE